MYPSSCYFSLSVCDFQVVGMRLATRPSTSVAVQCVAETLSAHVWLEVGVTLLGRLASYHLLSSPLDRFRAPETDRSRATHSLCASWLTRGKVASTPDPLQRWLYLPCRQRARVTRPAPGSGSADVDRPATAAILPALFSFLPSLERGERSRRYARNAQLARESHGEYTLPPCASSIRD
jgi:hypothetical protein